MKNFLMSVCFLFVATLAHADDIGAFRIQDVLLESVENLMNFEVPAHLRNDPEFQQFIRYVFDSQSDVRLSLTNTYRQLGMGPVELFQQMKSILKDLHKEAEQVQQLKETILRSTAPALVSRLKVEFGASIYAAVAPSLQIGLREHNGRVRIFLSCGLHTACRDGAGFYAGVGAEAYKSYDPLRVLESTSAQNYWAVAGLGKSRSEHLDGAGEATTFAVGFGWSERSSEEIHYLNIPIASFRGSVLKDIDKLQKLENRIAKALLQLRIHEVHPLLESYREKAMNLAQQASDNYTGKNRQTLVATHPFYNLASLISSAPQVTQLTLGQACLRLLKGR